MGQAGREMMMRGRHIPERQDKVTDQAQTRYTELGTEPGQARAGASRTFRTFLYNRYKK